jgi:hypothetical protein
MFGIGKLLLRQHPGGCASRQIEVASRSSAFAAGRAQRRRPPLSRCGSAGQAAGDIAYRKGGIEDIVTTGRIGQSTLFPQGNGTSGSGQAAGPVSRSVRRAVVIAAVFTRCPILGSMHRFVPAGGGRVAEYQTAGFLIVTILSLWPF